ncbi:hypothetical protein Fcan01_25582 [Folsomia candida]|uniref:F-box domain-containing protein n=1 Tax=Folsomia candida TaxID=158441 RepID=A0A226D422_FOLCA|nr:hypothetical protein Fcan01_25582 [Folsomia candida]
MDLEPRGLEGHISQPPHLAVVLPEILSVILSYVPTTDLLDSVTFVSRGWEEAAREHLVSRPLVELTPFNTGEYLDPTNTRSYPHKRVHLYNFNFPQMSPEASHLIQTFISSSSTTRITELHLEYFPHGGEPIPAQILSLFSSCPFLKCVRFSPQKFTREMFLPFVMLPTLVTFPNITKLGIDLPQRLFLGKMSLNVVRTISQETILGIVALFPNLKILQGKTFPQDLVEYFLSQNLSIQGISLRLDKAIKRRPLSIVTRSIFLTRIEFQIDILNKSKDHYVILATFSDRLEKLKFSGVNIIPPKSCTLIRATTITLPMQGRRVKYAKQFPVLEKFVVSKVECFYDMLNDEEWFEMCASFLCKYFLHGESLTVRDVHVPLPLKATTFPNLRTNLENIWRNDPIIE